MVTRRVRYAAAARRLRWLLLHPCRSSVHKEGGPERRADITAIGDYLIEYLVRHSPNLSRPSRCRISDNQLRLQQMQSV